MNVSVVGLGKLGAPLAAVLAGKGHKVIGVDLNEEFVRAINEGRAPVIEPGLDDLVQKSHARLSATSDFQAAIAETEVTFIIVPTPSEASGGFSLRYVMSAIESIGKALRKKDEFHLVILTSTVMPDHKVQARRLWKATDEPILLLVIHQSHLCGACKTNPECRLCRPL